jgi:hypothetical protein
MTPGLRPRTPVVLVGLLIALTVEPACSFLLVDGPPPANAPPPQDFVCTTNAVVPALDAVGGLAVIVHEFGDVGKPDSEWTGLSLSKDHRYILTAALATALLASAGVGYRRVRDCRAATTGRPPGP